MAKQTAKAVAMTVYLDCPWCGEHLEDSYGSYQITSDSFPNGKAKCVACGRTSELPKTARLFA